MNSPKRGRGYCLIVACILAFLLSAYTALNLSDVATHASPRNCGDITQMSTTIPRLQAALCFQQAHQQCVAAVFTESDLTIDIGTYSTIYRTANNLGRCTVSIVYTHEGNCRNVFICLLIIPLNLIPPPHDDCSALIVEQNGLRFSHCGEKGDVLFNP